MATAAGTAGSMAMPASKTRSSCLLISCYRAHGEARRIRTISWRAVIRATRSRASASIAASTMREHMYLRAVSSCAKSGSPSSARQSRRQHKYSDSIYCRETEAGHGQPTIKKLFHRQNRGQFEAESVLGDGQSCTGGIALGDIARSGTVRNLGVRNRSRTRL